MSTVGSAPETTAAVVAPAVELVGCDIGYEGRAVVHGLDLTIGTGEVVGILGSNGSGKSTTIRGLLGLTPVLAGEVRLFGTPRSQFHDWARIGYVPQRQTVAGGIPSTVGEVVASGRLTRLRPWRRSTNEDRTAVADAIAEVCWWTSIPVPGPGDPGPFRGSPALG